MKTEGILLILFLWISCAHLRYVRGSGTCPILKPGTFGTCVELCSEDRQCPFNQKCCSNGCGHVCKDAVDPDNDCPNGPLACKPPACDVITCPRQTGAVCRATCNGCIPHFFDMFGNEVTDKCQCPGRMPEYDCPDECKSKRCKGHPGAECRVNRCGGCTAIFYDRFGKVVKCRSKGRGRCPRGIRKHYCPDLCRGRTCPRRPDARCKVNRCGGCKAIFFDRFGRVVECGSAIHDVRCRSSKAPVSKYPCGPQLCSQNSDCRSDYMCCALRCGTACQRKPTLCEPGERLTSCQNACKFATCPKHPGANCRVHGCGGCKTEFYDDQNLLIEDC